MWTGGVVLRQTNPYKVLVGHMKEKKNLSGHIWPAGLVFDTSALKGVNQRKKEIEFLSFCLLNGVLDFTDFLFFFIRRVSSKSALYGSIETCV